MQTVVTWMFSKRCRARKQSNQLITAKILNAVTSTRNASATNTYMHFTPKWFKISMFKDDKIYCGFKRINKQIIKIFNSRKSY